jgi:hypothetical protein
VVAGVVRPVEEADERCDGFEQQCVELGPLIGGVMCLVTGDEPVPLGRGLVLVLGGLPERSLRPCSGSPAPEEVAADGDGIR